MNVFHFNPHSWPVICYQPWLITQISYYLDPNTTFSLIKSQLLYKVVR